MTQVPVTSSYPSSTQMTMRSPTGLNQPGLTPLNGATSGTNPSPQDRTHNVIQTMLSTTQATPPQEFTLMALPKGDVGNIGSPTPPKVVLILFPKIWLFPWLTEAVMVDF